jgi:predicted AlkP superfamily phosphohydrolase/phosphomutase
VFHVNAWLEQRGYLAWSKEALARQDGGEALLGVGQVARHTFLMDWERTRVFATTPTSNGIFIVRSTGDGRGVPDAEYHALRERLVQELLAEKDPATGEAVVRRIYTREEAFPGPFSALAPDLTLSLADGGLVSILPSEHVLSARPTVAGSHRPEGVFLAKGPGVRRGANLGELSILDVAPTLLYGLGLPVPAELEGRVPTELFEAEALRERPIRTGAAGGASEVREAPAAYAQTFGADEEEAVMKRLQELGYVE